MHVDAYEQAFTGHLVIVLDLMACAELRPVLADEESGVPGEVNRILRRHLKNRPDPQPSEVEPELGPGWRIVDGEPVYSADWL